MLLSLVILNKSLENIETDLAQINNQYKNIEIIILDKKENEIKKNKKEEIIKNINSEHIAFFYNEIPKIEYIDEIIKNIKNKSEIILFNNSFDYKFNPYIEYNNLELEGQEFFRIIINSNRDSLIDKDCIENNFFVKVFKKEFIKKLEINYIETLIFDISILLYAKIVKYLDIVISLNNTNYLSEIINKEIFNDIVILANNSFKIIKKNILNFLDVYINSLAHNVINIYYLRDKQNELNNIEKILKSYKNYKPQEDFIIELHNNTPNLYNRLPIKEKLEHRYESYEYNVYYIMKENKDNNVISKIIENIELNPKNINILIMDESDKYEIDKDYFNEIYDLQKLNAETKKYIFLYKLLGLKYESLREEIKYNIFLYTDEGVFDYSINEYTNYKLDKIPDNISYSNNILLMKYCEYNRDFHTHMEHSMYYGSTISPDNIWRNYPTNIVFSKVRYHSIKPRVIRPVFKIGPYINYAKDYIHTKLENKIKEVLGKTLVVFPAHTAGIVHYKNTNETNFINYINNIKTKYNYKTVILCGYINDIENRLLKEYMKENYYLVSGGNRNGEFFYNKLKTIINISDTTMSNKVGTHIGFSLFLNRPHNLYANNINFNIKGKPMKYYYEAVSNLHTNFLYEEMVFKDLFKEYTKVITENQHNLCNMFFGFDQIKSKDEIKFILEFSKEMHDSCKEQIDEITKNEKDAIERKIKSDKIYNDYIIKYLDENKNSRYYDLVFDSMCDFYDYININN